MPGLDDSQASLNSNASSNRSASSYFTYPVSYAVTGLLRRIGSGDPSTPKDKRGHIARASTEPNPSHSRHTAEDSQMKGVYTPPRRKLSPFQPPPLTPLSLMGWRSSTTQSERLLTKALAEEIRLLLPPRLQLVDEWSLVYSLEQNGVSLATLYEKADDYRGKRGGFVLVVRDGSGGVFGAYLSDPPHPSSHFYGNGECFLWRASVLPNLPDLISLPPPPSADTTNAVRMTTISHEGPKPASTLSPPSSEPVSKPGSGTNTPDRIRFKAFPYSGVNDYMIFCEHSYLSVGGGDGHYGLWLDDNFEKGISSTCPTFGNEPLSEDGNKFDVLGVELWYIGA